jgi:hypothetical protein
VPTTPTPSFTTPTEGVATTTPGTTAETAPGSGGEAASEGEPGADGSLTLAGTVLHTNPAAKSYTLTSQAGQMSAIHTRDGLPDPGTKLDVKVRTLANGTYAEDGKRRRTGHRNVASLGGTVTFSDAAASAYTVSTRGASVLVRVEPGAKGRLPDVGSSVTVSGRIRELEPGPATSDGGPSWTPVPATQPSQAAECGEPPAIGRGPEFTVTQRSVDAGSEFVGFSDLEAVVQGICESSNRLLVSADDVDEAQQNLSIAVGDADVDLDELEIGDVLAISAEIDDKDGSLKLSRLADDGGIKAADAGSADEGDESED